jgi:SAM-dependent methyltransferase
MQYDPIKRKLGVVFNASPALRKLFYHLLDLLLLRSWHIRKALKKWARESSGPRHILDAGSGFGQYDYYLAKKYKDSSIKAVDVKEEQIADCSRFFQKVGLDNVTFELADLTKFKENDTYDLILCVDVMEHIEEDELVLRNYYASLKQGGMLLISTPSDKGGSDVHHHEHEDYVNDGTHSFVDEHVRDGYGIGEMEQKMNRAGFTRTQVEYQYGKPGKLGWRLSMKYPIIMLNTSYIFFILLPFYYLVTFPLVLVLNWLDIRGKHKTGTGLVARAWK